MNDASTSISQSVSVGVNCGVNYGFAFAVMIETNEQQPTISLFAQTVRSGSYATDPL
jgi:hypothetical protein